MPNTKLQILYTNRHLPPYMADVHQDDREMGTVTRLWDHPSPDHPVGLLVLAPHSKDLSADLVIEHARQIGCVQDSPTRVEYNEDGMHPGKSSMWIKQDGDAIVINETQDAVDIAMRLLLWAKLEQEKANASS